MFNPSNRRSNAPVASLRGYYYHPSRHSAGQPIVAGWAYQIVAELGFERDSWVAPVDARRVSPAEETDEAAAEQIQALMGQLPEPETDPIFVFDAGYDPVKLQRALEGCPARILVRLHSNRVFYAEPEFSFPRPVGRPRRHGEKFDLKAPRVGLSLQPNSAVTATFTVRCVSDAGQDCTLRPGR